MKDSSYDFEERLQAASEFAPLLVTHAKAEEKSLYDFLKTKPEFREYAFEGMAEHTIADQLCEEISAGGERDELGGKIKVLAEAVEHHIKEEENDILPDVQKKIDKKKLVALTDVYNKVQEELIAMGQDDSPAESTLKNEPRLHS
jgi:hypothetical protein